MAMEPELVADEIGLRLVAAEDAAAPGVQHALVDKRLNGLAAREGRVELDQRGRPEEALGEAGVDVRPEPRVGEVDETADVGGVVLDELLAEGEDVHA